MGASKAGGKLVMVRIRYDNPHARGVAWHVGLSGAEDLAGEGFRGRSFGGGGFPGGGLAGQECSEAICKILPPKQFSSASYGTPSVRFLNTPSPCHSRVVKVPMVPEIAPKAKTIFTLAK